MLPLASVHRHVLRALYAHQITCACCDSDAAWYELARDVIGALGYTPIEAPARRELGANAHRFPWPLEVPFGSAEVEYLLGAGTKLEFQIKE